MFTSTFAVGPQRWALDPGALRPLIDSYVADLASRGYEAAAIHHLEHSARHFCYWLNHSGIAVSQTDGHVIKRFAEHRRHCPGYRASEILSAAFAGMVRKFVGFLEESRIVQPAAASTCDGSVHAYLDWLREHRGLSEQTLAARRKLMNQLLPLLGPDPFVLRDVTTILADCGLRPEECFRLRWEHIRDGAAHVPVGKTENARRTISLTPRSLAILEMRRAVANGPWVFPASTESGHIEKSTLKKQHPKTCRLAKVTPFPLYTFRHTCLTRWAEFMDPFTLAYLAGHSDFSTTKRYVHAQAHTVRAAIERARVAQGGHSSGHTSQTDIANQNAAIAAIQ